MEGYRLIQPKSEHKCREHRQWQSGEARGWAVLRKCQTDWSQLSWKQPCRRDPFARQSHCKGRESSVNLFAKSGDQIRD